MLIMFLEFFFVLSVFFCAALSDTDMYGCDITNIEPGSNKIYNDQCKSVSTMVQQDPNYYVDCIQNQYLLNLTGALDNCWMRDPKHTKKITFAEAILMSCKPENEFIGKKNICCVITEELKGTGKTSEDKYKYSQDCINQYRKAYPNSGV